LDTCRTHIYLVINLEGRKKEKELMIRQKISPSFWNFYSPSTQGDTQNIRNMYTLGLETKKERTTLSFLIRIYD